MNGCLNMARMTIKGLDDLEINLSKLDDSEIAKKCVYAGAKVIADEIRDRLKSNDTLEKEQLRDLLDSLGVAPILTDANGDVNTKIGFKGYGKKPTKKYPLGLPNQMMARAVESGTSFRPKRPFVRPAVNAKKKEALRAMQETYDKEIAKKLKK